MVHKFHGGHALANRKSQEDGEEFSELKLRRMKNGVGMSRDSGRCSCRAHYKTFPGKSGLPPQLNRSSQVFSECGFGLHPTGRGELRWAQRSTNFRCAIRQMTMPDNSYFTPDAASVPVQ